MNKQKTQPTNTSVEQFIAAIDDPQKREDCMTLLQLFHEITGEPAKLWGSSIVGFGSYHYKYGSGHEGGAAITGFSPRKQNLTIYVMDGFEKYKPLLEKLGKHKTSVSCLYIKRLADIDLAVLRKIVEQSVAEIKKLYPTKS